MVRLNARNVCGAVVLALAVAVFVLSIVLGYLISTEFMVFAFPLFITTLMCGVKCMEPCSSQPADDESDAEAHLNSGAPHTSYGSTSHHHHDDSDTVSSDDDDDDDDDDTDVPNKSNPVKPGEPASSSKHHAKTAGPLALQDWLESSTTDPSAKSTNGNAQQDDSDDDGKTCIICLDKPREMVFRKCGHMCLCRKCCKRMRRCPICQRKSKAIRVQLV